MRSFTALWLVLRTLYYSLLFAIRCIIRWIAYPGFVQQAPERLPTK